MKNQPETMGIHSEFESSIRNGSFHPTTLLMYLEVPSGLFSWDTSVDIERTLYHEYMHFVQCTTTPFGFNTFLRELEIMVLTINAVRDLIEHTSELILPLSKCLQITKNKKTASILNEYFNARYMIEQDLAVNQGFWKFDKNKITYKQKTVQCEYGCRCLTYPNDSSMPEYVPLGARALMEGAASLTEFHCLRLINAQE
jgi:hypothetical protein